MSRGNIDLAIDFLEDFVSRGDNEIAFDTNNKALTVLTNKLNNKFGSS
jgi:hypothetical protein